MPKLVFASNNEHKTSEIKSLLKDKYEILNLKDINCTTDIPETGNTFAENATLKSSFVTQNYQIDCFADDSGLEIEALNLAPGIYSARYAGTRNDLDNLNLVLKNMQGKTNRQARFKTVISLQLNGKNYLFEGKIEGKIAEKATGKDGFGYDPIFIPDGYSISFAEMSKTQKNKISHRALAVQQLISFLNGV
ncbi:MAG: non-canonical purine NTP diphosphatase [Sphingobacteriaceae bacterium]|nr:non-canonical purine NTP diphosphatase [Sphingobacteriaceae bacterium]